MNAYTTRAEAIEREIVEALGEYSQDFDVEAMADAIIDTDERGRYFCSVDDPAEFWEIAARHDITA